MDIKTYDTAMRLYSDKLAQNFTCELFDEVTTFQYTFMRDFLANYQNKADTDAKKVICDLLHHVIEYSTSGNSIVDIASEDLANEVDEIIYEEIGDMLLDCEVYALHGQWQVDVMFGGFYTPAWDGWQD